MQHSLPFWTVTPVTSNKGQSHFKFHYNQKFCSVIPFMIPRLKETCSQTSTCMPKSKHFYAVNKAAHFLWLKKCHSRHVWMFNLNCLNTSSKSILISWKNVFKKKKKELTLGFAFCRPCDPSEGQGHTKWHKTEEDNGAYEYGRIWLKVGYTIQHWTFCYQDGQTQPIKQIHMLFKETNNKQTNNPPPPLSLSLSP